MLFRKMNKVESGLSILGFGCMRLPVTKDGNIDENQAKALPKNNIANFIM